MIANVVPGKHTTRKGWLTKDFHYPQSPYTSDINARIWKTQFGDTKSLREIATETAWFFRKSIRRYSDPFSLRLLFAVLEGRAPSMLELIDRPAAYEDVGHLCKWGMVIHELKNYGLEMDLLGARREAWEPKTIDEFVTERERARVLQNSEMASVNEGLMRSRSIDSAVAKQTRSISLIDDPQARPNRGNAARRQRPKAALTRRKTDAQGKLIPPRNGSEYLDRRGTSLLAQKPPRDRRSTERRRNTYTVPFPDRRLTRSAYEQVFLKLVSGSRLKVGKDLYTPVGMKGWYHAILRRDSDGRERLLSIDQLLKKMNDWV